MLTLRSLLLGLVLFLILALPFSGVGSPIKMPYVFIFLVSGAIGFLLCLMRAVKYRDLFAISTIGFVLVVIMSSFFNISSYGVASARDLFAFILVLFLPFLVWFAVNTISQKNIVVYSFLFTALLNFAVGVVQLVQGVDPVFGNVPVGGRMTGYFSWGAPVVGSFAGAVIPLLYGRFIRNSGGVHAFLLVLFYLIILVGGNRSMLVSAVVAHVFVALFVSKSSRKVLLGELFLMLAGVFFLGSIVIIYAQEYLSSNIVSRIVSLGGNIIEEQKTKRIATWVQTICMVADHPSLGVGFGNYEAALSQYLSCALKSEGSMPHPHQVYLDLVSTLGFIGFLVFSVYIVVLLVRVFQGKNEAFRVEGVMVVFIFFSPLNVTHGFISLWWAIIIFTLVGLLLVNKKLEVLRE